MRCGACNAPAERMQCGGPSFCDHGLSLRGECEECRDYHLKTEGSTYRWYCECGWRSPPPEAAG